MLKRGYIVTVLLGIFVILNGQQMEESPGSEIGDAVFRSKFINLPYTLNWGHTGIYFCSAGLREWEVNGDLENSDGWHSVIQASGFGTEVGSVTFSYFLSGFTQWGKGYTSPRLLSVNERKNILNIARNQYGAKYPELHPFDPEKNEWYYPKIMTPRDIAHGEEGCFRCDGLVEYVYEQVVGGFFSEEEKYHCWYMDENGNWNGFLIFCPRELMLRMVPEQPTPPEVEVVSPEEGEDIEDNIHIEFTADDGEYGSGIDVVYVYVDNELVYRDDEDSDGEKGVEYDYDASGLTEGNHYVKISVYDRAGNLREEEIKVYKGEAPYVVLVYPIGGGIPIDCGRVWIIFSRPMNRASVEGAVSMEPSVAWTANWLDDKTVVFNFSEYLDYCETYMVTITDDAMDITGKRLDGDEDGEPGGDYTFSFTTEIPNVNVYVSPSSHLFLLPPGGVSISGDVVVDGAELKKEINIEVTKVVTGEGLEVYGGEGIQTIPAGGSVSLPITVTAYSEGRISASFTVRSTDYDCLEVSGDALFSAIDTSSDDGDDDDDDPGDNEHPDDNQSPGESHYPSLIVLQEDTMDICDNVGVLLNGWGKGYGHLMGRYGIKMIPIFSDFTYWRNPDTTLSDVVKLIVIGSGGLHPFLYDNEFRTRLADYVAS